MERLRRAIGVVPGGAWPLRRRIGAATLDFDRRHRRRLRIATDDGVAFLLDLKEPAILRGGDGLILDDGGVVEVIEAEEDVCDVAAATPAELTRLAWHLGNRHLPVAILAAGLRIRDDHVIAEMLEGLGATVVRRRAVFTPEAGAYAAEPHHHHDDHDYDRDHDHDHRH